MVNNDNLVFNGDLSLGTAGWGSGITVQDGVASLPYCSGKVHSVLIPVYGNDVFKVEFDVMNTTTDTRYFYCAMYAVDRTGAHVGINLTEHPASSCTTLT